MAERSTFMRQQPAFDAQEFAAPLPRISSGILREPASDHPVARNKQGPGVVAASLPNCLRRRGHLAGQFPVATGFAQRNLQDGPPDPSCMSGTGRNVREGLPDAGILTVAGGRKYRG